MSTLESPGSGQVTGPGRPRRGKGRRVGSGGGPGTTGRRGSGPGSGTGDTGPGSGTGDTGPGTDGREDGKALPLVEVRRSPRRRRTVSAYREGTRTVVLIPARMSRSEEQRWVAAMLERLEAQERRRRPSDEALLARARDLCRRHLDGAVEPTSVRWVTNQGSRWGSCTLADRSIRLSHRLQGMPAWVVDYVLLHECAHLLEPSHDQRFWEIVGRYPRTERARGYLEGVAATAELDLSDESDL